MNAAIWKSLMRTSDRPAHTLQHIENAKSKGEGAEFPAVRIKKLLEHFMQYNVRPQDVAMFRTQLAALFDVVERVFLE